MPTRTIVLAFLLALAPLVARAQEQSPDGQKKKDPTRLTIRRIYRGGEFRAAGYSARWLARGGGYVRLEKSSGPNGGQDIVRYEPDSGRREVLVPAEHLVPEGTTTPLAINGYSWSDDGSKLLIYTNSKRVWRQNSRGDYWVLDRTSRELRKLGGDAPASSLMFAKLSPDGRHVAYVRENNIYCEQLGRQAPTTQLTTDGSETIINGTFDWVYEEELRLRDGFRWSPDSRSIAYWQLDSEGVRQFPLVRNTAGLYPEIQHIRYPKTGETNSAARIGVVDLADRQTHWLPLGGDPRNNYLARLHWAPGTRQLVVQQLNRLQNANRLWRFDVDAVRGKPRREALADGVMQQLFVEQDDAWVNVHDELQWLADAPGRFTWISERDGWRHLYVASTEPGDPQRVTGDDCDVISLQHVDDELSGWAYYMASPDNATQQYLYRVRLDGSDPQRLTPSDQPGTHSYNISPDGNWALHTWSRFDEPPTTDLVRLPSCESVRVLEENKKLKANLQKLGRRRPRTELFKVEIGDDVTLDAWCIRPAEMEPDKKYPLLVYVYGEPAGQTVLDRWGGSTQLWHRMLAQQGYVVMSFDNRGTPAPKGRQWRKCVYRQVGILAPREQAAAVRQVLQQRPCLDAERVGVWGWSGGGSMTLNAMFKFPDLYHTGVSVAPVPNQRLYDTIYQERYMGLPSDNVQGYYDGSAVNFAKHLKGNLLLIHGTGDDNCHYQGTEALINELVKYNRPFTMMAYPNRSHGIHEGVNTGLHLRELMTSFLHERLPPGPR